jgi:3-methyladenine DNA glycosylase/8-oxoguanine DNA glycosylase
MVRALTATLDGRRLVVRAAGPADPAPVPDAWRARLGRDLEAAAPGSLLEVRVAAADLPDVRAWLRFRALWPDLRAGRLRTRQPHLRAALHLAERDEALARVIAAAGAVAIPQRSSTFATLARAIAYQQLSGKAASTIWGRVRALVGGHEPSAEEILARRTPTLRRAGLSAAKVLALQDLARHVRRREIVPEALYGMADDEVIARLTRVRGIGRWSAQMHLIFSLGRPDVWPTGDLGVRKGFARWRGLAADPTEKDLEPLGEPYRPHRTHAAWFAWRALEVGAP